MRSVEPHLWHGAGLGAVCGADAELAMQEHIVWLLVDLQYAKTFIARLGEIA